MHEKLEMLRGYTIALRQNEACRCAKRFKGCQVEAEKSCELSKIIKYFWWLVIYLQSFFYKTVKVLRIESYFSRSRLEVPRRDCYSRRKA